MPNIVSHAQLEGTLRQLATLAQTALAGLRDIPQTTNETPALNVIRDEVAALREAMATRVDDDPDPLLGLEYIRKTKFEPPMSKFAFYGGNGSPGFVGLLEVIDVGPRKRCVRLSNFNAVLDGRKRQNRTTPIAA